MPRYDDDEDDDRPRRKPARRDEDDEEDRPRRRRSEGGRNAGVTTVGVLTIVLGVLELLWSCGCGIAGILFFSGGVAVGQAVEQDQNLRFDGAKGLFAAIGTFGAVMMFVGAAVMFVLALAFLFSGYGVVRRQGWARIMTLILAALVGLLGLLGIVGFVVRLLSQNRPPVPSLLGNVVVSLLLVGYAVLSYVLLLTRSASEEFR
jgi:hypothetical protein